MGLVPFVHVDGMYQKSWSFPKRVDLASTFRTALTKDSSHVTLLEEQSIIQEHGTRYRSGTGYEDTVMKNGIGPSARNSRELLQSDSIMNELVGEHLDLMCSLVYKHRFHSQWETCIRLRLTQWPCFDATKHNTSFILVVYSRYNTERHVLDAK